MRRRHGLRLAALANDFDDAARRGLHDDDLVIHDNKVKAAIFGQQLDDRRRQRATVKIAWQAKERPAEIRTVLPVPLFAMPQSPAFALDSILTCGLGLSPSFFGGKK